MESKAWGTTAAMFLENGFLWLKLRTMASHLNILSSGNRSRSWCRDPLDSQERFYMDDLLSRASSINEVQKTIKKIVLTLEKGKLSDNW